MSAGWTTRTVELPSGRTHVETRGEGPAFVWAHGLFFPIDVENHTPIRPFLERIEGYKVVRYDARGHGRSQAGPTPDHHTSRALGADLVALLDRLEIATCIAGGTSMGSATVLHGAVRQPDRFEGLLVAIPPNAYHTRARQVKRYLGLEKLLGFGGTGAVARAVALSTKLNPMVPGCEKAHAPATANIRQWQPEALQKVLSGYSRGDLPSLETLRKVTAPVSLYFVDNDPNHPVDTAHALSSVLDVRETSRQPKLTEDGLVRAFDALVEQIQSPA